MEEEKNQNLPGNSYNPQPASTQAPTQGKDAQELLFYNVMPQKTKTGSVIDPTITVVTDAGGSVPGTTSGSGVQKLLKYKKIIFISLGIVVLAVASYIGITKFTQKQYETEDLLGPRVKNQQTKDQQTSTPSASSTVTTSAEWQLKYFGSVTCQELEKCGDGADLDIDGLTNVEEFKQGADPNNRDCDGDGLSDGDELHVFGTLVCDAHTAKDPDYNDGDYIKGSYSVSTGKPMTTAESTGLSSKMNEFKLHQPTLTTLKDVLVPVYNFGDSQKATSSPETASSTPKNATTTPLAGFDLSVEAKQDRDAQRSATIKNIEIGLVKYNSDRGQYPVTSSFQEMYDKVKIYLKVATKATDPVNKDPYVYAYTSSPDGNDFTLSFYSEVAGLQIKKHAAEAVKDTNEEQANIYDEQRKDNLQMLQSALLIYSNQNIDGEQEYAFPTKEKYQTALVPAYMSQIPKDPKTGVDYEYQVSATFDTFTLKTPLDNPTPGTTGWLCNQEECRAY